MACGNIIPNMPHHGNNIVLGTRYAAEDMHQVHPNHKQNPTVSNIQQ